MKPDWSGTRGVAGELWGLWHGPRGPTRADLGGAARRCGAGSIREPSRPWRPDRIGKTDCGQDYGRVAAVHGDVPGSTACRDKAELAPARKGCRGWPSGAIRRHAVRLMSCHARRMDGTGVGQRQCGEGDQRVPPQHGQRSSCERWRPLASASRDRRHRGRHVERRLRHRASFAARWPLARRP